MLRQFNDGTHLNDQYVLRTFPFTATDYSMGIRMSICHQPGSGRSFPPAQGFSRNGAGGQAAAMDIRSQSFRTEPYVMATGYNFAPHFAYCLKNIVGSLPVGMIAWMEICRTGVPPIQATSKKYGLNLLTRFLGTVSIYANHKSTSPAGKEKNVRIDVLEKRNPQGTVNVIIRLSGTENMK